MVETVLLVLSHLSGIGFGAWAGWWLALNSKEQWTRIDAAYRDGFEASAAIRSYGASPPSSNGEEK